MTLQDYDPEWSETEPSDETVPERADTSASNANAVPEAINAGVSPGPVPTEDTDISEQRREEIVFLLQQRLQAEVQADTPSGAEVAGHLGACGAGFRLQNPLGQPAATPSMVNMSRTVWQQGSHVATSCLSYSPGAPAARNAPWRLRLNAAATESSDFGLGPVVLDAAVTRSYDLQGHASSEMHIAPSSSHTPALRPRGQIVLPPRRRSPMADEINATPGFTSLPPRPPRMTRPRPGPYDLPGPESSREERANAAFALGMSRRHYERVVLGMNR